jgi:hypothetical protein
MKKGRMMYVPPVVIEELEDLQMEHHEDKRALAFEKMADYARVGRETERLINFKSLGWPLTSRKARR